MLHGLSSIHSSVLHSHDPSSIRMFGIFISMPFIFISLPATRLEGGDVEEDVYKVYKIHSGTQNTGFLNISLSYSLSAVCF